MQRRTLLAPIVFVEGRILETKHGVFTYRIIPDQEHSSTITGSMDLVNERIGVQIKLDHASSAGYEDQRVRYEG